MTTLFAKIVRGEMPADIVYQDELVTAFREYKPPGADTCADCSQQGDSNCQ